MKNVTLLATLTFAVSAPLPSIAETFKVIPEVGLSYRNYEYKINDDRYFKEIFPAIRYGVNMAYGKAFANLYGESSIDSNQQTNINPTFSPGTSAEIDRDDVILTGGYRLNNSLSLFGGYKWGRTTVDFTANQNSVTDEIKSKGFFAGVNYSMKVGPGLVSANLAYAVLDTDFRLNNINLESDGDGFSTGISWNSIITKNLLYSIGWDTQLYKYDDLQSSDPNFTLTSKLDLKERQDTFRVLLKYAF